MSLGKWIGGIVGFMTLGPLGALAGIVIGSMFDEKDKYVQDGQGYNNINTGTQGDVLNGTKDEN